MNCKNRKVWLTEALPASIVPFFLNTGGSFARVSTVDSGFGCSSVSTTTSPGVMYIQDKFNHQWHTLSTSDIKVPFSVNHLNLISNIVIQFVLYM